MRAVLGLLVVGMAVGAAAAGVMILSGGSYLSALAIYSLVSTTVVLGVALVWFALSERKAGKATRDDSLPEDPLAAID